MVRLVFRPYIQVRRTICTSVSLRASTRVSPGFALLRHSSPSFGSQQTRSHSNFSPQIVVGRWYSCPNCYLHFACGIQDPNTRTCVWTPWSVFQDGSYDTLQANTMRKADLAEHLHERDATSSNSNASSARTKRKLSPINVSPHTVPIAVFPPKEECQQVVYRARTRVSKRRGMRGASPT